MVRTLSGVLGEMRQICRDWGVGLYFQCDAWLAFESVPVNGYFILLDQSHPPVIEVHYSEFAIPQQIFWCFLHEFSHCLQWLENSNNGFHLMYNRDDDGGVNDRKYLEIDAWVKAEILSEAMSMPISGEFYRIRRACLLSYGVNVDAIDFVALRTVTLPARAESSKPL